MSAPRPYPTYVQYSAQTFARLPIGWRVIRARHLVRIRTGSGDTVDAEPGGKYPFYVRSDRPLRSDRWEFDTTAVLTAGDGAGVAKVFHLAEGKFTAHQRVYVLDSFQHVSARFFFYAFSSLFHLMALDGSAKSTVDSVRRPMIADMPIPVPSDAAQEAIVRFLDSEIACIEELIEEQGRLTQLLRERRAAIISHAVDVGELTKLRRVIAELRQGWSPNCEPWPADGVTEWAVLKVGCANSGTFDPLENKRLPDDEAPRPELAVRTNELVMSRSNTKDLVGATAVVRGSYPRLLLSDLTYGLTLTPDADPEFVAYCLGAAAARVQISAASKGSSPSMQKISQRDVRELVVRLPPVTDQRRIAARLATDVGKIDQLVAEAERFIELARERRFALITAAVTGEINVQGVS